MTKHRCTSHIGETPVRGSPPLAAHQPPGVVAVAAAAAAAATTRLSTSFCVCVCMRRRLSLFCDIRFPNSPHSVRGATERKHLDILEYEHCVNIRSVLSSLFLSISSVRVSRVLHLVSCVSLFFFFFNARITGWAALRSMESFPQFSGVPRLPVMGDYGPRAENETFSLFS